MQDIETSNFDYDLFQLKIFVFGMLLLFLTSCSTFVFTEPSNKQVACSVL